MRGAHTDSVTLQILIVNRILCYQVICQYPVVAITNIELTIANIWILSLIRILGDWLRGLHSVLCFVTILEIIYKWHGQGLDQNQWVGVYWKWNFNSPHLQCSMKSCNVEVGVGEGVCCCFSFMCPFSDPPLMRNGLSDSCQYPHSDTRTHMTHTYA